jgi:hypothetical protein
MYLVPLMTAVTEALRSVFTTTYPEPDFRSVNVSIDYPVKEADYPSLWVQYEDNEDLVTAGIGHVEYISSNNGQSFTPVHRWKFKGTVTITISTLSSLERDRLYDEVVKVFAFGQENVNLKVFRDKIETNDLIGMNANFDDLRPFGSAAAMGTPWGGDEVIYEKSLSFDLQGEFVGDPTVPTLIPLSEVTFIDFVDGTPTPKFPNEPGSTTAPPTPGDWDRTDWT